MSSKSVIALALLVMSVVFTAGMLVDPAQLVAATGALIHKSAPPAAAADGAIVYTIDTTKSDKKYARPLGDRSVLAHQPPVGASCTLPALDDQALFVLFNGYQGAAISSVALDGVNRETTVADVQIQPGTRPLYLMMQSYGPIIWRFKGATDRIAQLVLLSELKTVAGRPIVGEIGVDAAKLTTDLARDCLPYSMDDASAGEMAAAALQQRIGRKPDIQGHLYTVDRLQLPSALAANIPADSFDRPEGFDRDEWAEALRFRPGGLVQVDAGQVRGPVDALAYDILPNEMGLAQLVGTGALTHEHTVFKIVKPLTHFPAELTGAHAVTFVLASGVPLPDGDPGHSCVLNEGGGRATSGGLCR